MSYTKEYYERYAINSLIKCYDSRLESLEKSERPDYQSKDLDIGIEVTRAINNGERLFRINSVFGKNVPAEERKKMYEKRFPKSIGEEIMVVNNCLVASETKHPISSNIYMDLIIRAILKKNNLLNNGYAKFNNNWLYIFSQSASLNEYDIECVSRNIELYDKINYSKIFINCTDRIFVINNINSNMENKVESIDIEYETLVHLKSSSIL